MPRKYPEEFKRDVVGQALRPDRTIRDVAEDLGLAATTVQRWIAKYGEEMSEDPPPDIDSLVKENKRLATENRELVARNADLEEDREILKKRPGSSPRKRRMLRVHRSGTGESLDRPVVSGVRCSEVVVQ